MIGSPALQAAIDLVQVPTRMRHVRSQPLPEGLSILLRLAAGDEDALQKAAMQCGRSSCWLRGAAEFFIEQILFLLVPIAIACSARTLEQPLQS